jgi:hypothetical protein
MDFVICEAYVEIVTSSVNRDLVPGLAVGQFAEDVEMPTPDGGIGAPVHR